MGLLLSGWDTIGTCLWMALAAFRPQGEPAEDGWAGEWRASLGLEPHMKCGLGGACQTVLEDWFSDPSPLAKEHQDTAGGRKGVQQGPVDSLTPGRDLAACLEL